MLLKKIIELLDPAIKNDKEELERLRIIHGEFGGLRMQINKYLSNGNYLLEMNEQDRRAFVSDASFISQNKTFEKIINELLNIQATAAILENPKASNFHKGGINSLWMLREELLKLHSIHVQNVAKEEDYDEYGLLS